MLKPDMIRILPSDYDAGAWGAVLLAAESTVRISLEQVAGAAADEVAETSPVPFSTL
jgi:hypothetical protein